MLTFVYYLKQLNSHQAIKNTYTGHSPHGLNINKIGLNCRWKTPTILNFQTQNYLCPNCGFHIKPLLVEAGGSWGAEWNYRNKSEKICVVSVPSRREITFPVWTFQMSHTSHKLDTVRCTCSWQKLSEMCSAGRFWDHFSPHWGWTGQSGGRSIIKFSNLWGYRRHFNVFNF